MSGHRVALCVLLGLYAALACLVALTTPLFESPDESSHLQVIDFIRRERRLPPYQVPTVRASTGPSMAWLISYHDPPLYYAPPLYHTLAALLTSQIPMDDLSERLIPSPSWEQGYSPSRGTDPWNKNVFVHLPGETVTESGTARATAVLRSVSILLGAGVIVFTYGAVITVWPQRPWMAVAVVLWLVCNPQFVASHTGVSNDPLTNALFGASMLLMLYQMRSDASWLHWTGSGIVVGLAMLTKQSALMLLPIVGLGAFLSAYGERGLSRDVNSAKRGLTRATAFSVAAILVGGGWYLMNLTGYGDALGTRPHFDIQVPLANFGWREAWHTLQSYWAAFGWALITAPWWAYAPWCIAIGLAVSGLAKALLPGGSYRTESVFSRRALGLLALVFAMNCVAFVRWASATGAPYGRLLFPTAGAVTVLLVWGLAQWRSVWVRRSLLGLAGWVGLVALLLPWVSLRPAFRSPYRSEGLPASATIVEVQAEHVRLVGYEIDADALVRGDRLAAVLYWRSGMEGERRSPGELLSFSAQLRGIDPTRRIADDTRWLGGTLYPSAYWRAEDVVAHRVALEIPEWAPVPALVWLDLKLLDESNVLLTYGTGGEDTLSLGPWRVRGVVAIPDQAVRLGARLGPGIELAAYDLALEGNRLLIDLYWRAVGITEGDATVFVHLLNDAGDLVAQDDGQPAEGAYPTSWWLEGDVVRDRHEVRLAGEGDALLRLGMYSPETGSRLPAFGSDGERLQDDAILLDLDK